MAITSLMSCNDNTSGACNVSGKQAEALAARFLEQQGLQIVARNVHCRGGEIDLVCRDGKTLVFVEVRLRRNAGFGGAAASITRHKQQRVILAARHYLATQACANSDCRFDCVLLADLNVNSIEWIRDAFAVD